MITVTEVEIPTRTISERMARDKGLEELLNDSLDAVAGLTQKAMFGGFAWLVNGNLLCGARDDGMLVRLGKDRDAWALKIAGSSR